MPKKFVGENSKALAARERKAAAKSEAEQKKQKQLSDEMWRDDDKHAARKQNRKEEVERRKHEQHLKKQEKEALLRQEETQLSRQNASKQPSAKITRSQVAAERERIAENARKASSSSAGQKTTGQGSLQAPVPLQENINRVTVDGEEARSVSEAIAVLSVSGSGVGAEPDRHPERRMRAAYRQFEEEYLPQVKQENPGMRLTQLKQLVFKEWGRSDKNPMNQTHMAYNTK